MGSSDTKQQSSMAGRIINGRYELLEELAEGGMGRVYRTLDRELNKIVALKIIHEALSNNKSAIEMFKREASVCLELTHPNIVRLYNLELENNRLFLVMEYVDGPDLYEILRKKRRFELHEVIAIMRPLLEGLGAAHAEGVVHLDIKPENLIISKEGILKIADFGIAALYSVENIEAAIMNPRRQKEEVAGTVLYMAPEQLSKDHPIGPWVDIYACGCVIYELLTGLPPFYKSENIEEKKAEEDPPAPPNLPESFVQILMKMLCRDPRERYKTTREVLHDLTIFEAGVYAFDYAHRAPKIESAKAKTDGDGEEDDAVTLKLLDTEESGFEILPSENKTKLLKTRINLLILLCVSLLALLAVMIAASEKEKIFDEERAYRRNSVDTELETKLEIRGGKFTMGGAPADENAPHREVYLSGYYIDKYEVTVYRYAKCLKEGSCTVPAADQGCVKMISAPNKAPINCVTWHQAASFCEFSGGSLPTEAQWEYAAKGKTARSYPWGNEAPNCRKTQVADPDKNCKIDEAALVGSKEEGESPFGLQDMGGNLSEWVLDFYAPFGAYVEETDPAGPPSGKEKVVKGASYLNASGDSAFKNHSRQSKPPDYFGPELGFRCVYKVK